MSSQGAVDASISGTQGIEESSTARQKSSEKLSFQAAADIINKLKDLFLTDIVISYHEL